MISAPVIVERNIKNAAVNNMPTVIRDITIVNKNGLHARPSALFVKTASKFNSDISVELGDMKVSGKSIMGIITLEASFGKVIHVTAKGEDAKEMIKALEELVIQFTIDY